MGKKVVITLGIICIVLSSFLIPPIVKHFAIEALIKDLHSVDRSTQKKAAAELSEYGDSVVPKLIAELKKLPELEEPEVWRMNGHDSGSDNRSFEMGLVKVFLEFGEPTIAELLTLLPAKNLRIESDGPSIAQGRMMAFTRLPSGRRASTQGWLSSTRRPIEDTILSMMRIRWRSSRKRTLVSSRTPKRST